MISVEDEDGPLAPVRKRPGMYIGGTGPAGISHLVEEVVSNSVDQFLAGRVTAISVSVAADGSITIVDDGAGIPIEVDEFGVPFVQTAFTTLRDTPTADGHAPHIHLTYGVGLGPVCALCERITVEVRNELGTWRQDFSRGRAVSPLTQSGETSVPAGTTITLLADPTIFNSARVDAHMLEERMRELAFLIPGLTITFDRASSQYGPVSDLTELFSRAVDRGVLVHDGPFLMSNTDGRNTAELAIGWRSGAWFEPTIDAYCNFRRMGEGGTMVDGIEEGLRLVFGHGPVHRLMRGLVAVVHVTMIDPNFAGPTRGNLENPEAIWLVADAIGSHLPQELSRHLALEQDLRSRISARQ